MHLILIGLRGSGKTTAGRVRAGRLARSFVDLDDVTESMCGMTAQTCFETKGEAAWRAAESTALERTLASTIPSVIALGGGTPTAPNAVDRLETEQEAGRIRIIRLHAPADDLVARIADDSGRPPLTTLDPLDEMTAMEASRGPVLARLATTTIDTSDRSIEQVAEAIVRESKVG
ncbi:MAG: shikimate kinase [Phycisphaera sp.]|nr:shikimate kinase [Phycisphaera sp.]